MTKSLIAVSLLCAATTARAGLPSQEHLKEIISKAAGPDASLVESMTQAYAAQPAPDAVAYCGKRACCQEELNDHLLQELQLGNSEEAQFWLRQGAQAFAKMEDGTTALMLAADHGDLESAALLVRKSFVNSVNKAGETALSMAIGIDMVRLLLKNGAKQSLNRTFPYPSSDSQERATKLYAAIDSQDEEMALELLNAGANPNIDIPSKSGRIATPLLTAAETGSLKLVKALDAHQAKVGVTTAKGNAVNYAVFGDHVLGESKEVLAKLRYFHEDKGLSLNERSSDNHPLFAAIYHLDQKVVNYLLSHGVDVNDTKTWNGVPVIAMMAFICGDFTSAEDKASFLAILKIMIDTYHVNLTPESYYDTPLAIAERGAYRDTPRRSSVCKDMAAVIKQAGGH